MQVALYSGEAVHVGSIVCSCLQHQKIFRVAKPKTKENKLKFRLFVKHVDNIEDDQVSSKNYSTNFAVLKTIN